MKLSFLVILTCLYIAHDIGLSWWFKRRYAKDDDFIGKNAPNEMQRFFGKTVYFSLVYYVLVLFAVATGFDFWGLISNVVLLDLAVFEALGFVCGGLFLVLMTLVRLNLGSSWRIGLDYETTDQLVTNGFYRWVRNPYFTFLLGFQGSLFLIVPNAVMLCVFIQSALLLGFQVRQEEIFLQEKYGAPYLEYKRETGRFFPKIVREVSH